MIFKKLLEGYERFRQKYAGGEESILNDLSDLGQGCGGGIFDHDFGLVFNGDEVMESAFLDEFPLENNPDVVADFLNLFE